ncbi:MAG: hypothetical protein LBQ30_08025 [Treponema sp.]|jgi:hypothetical protein|nr:hypothetical protein [Treponema sp.]
MNLWNSNVEIDFFKKSLDGFASVEDLFYRLNSKYYAYIPKGSTSNGATIQSRNALIGKFTEKWAKDLFDPIAKKLGLFAINGVVCNSLGLNSQSSADLAFCTTNENTQKAENIKLLFEIKMSVISNYEYISDNEIKYLGDYKTHKGNPSLLRSDSMLKAIGKAINIRVSSTEGEKIPIIILGNSPITKNYTHKADVLKNSGVIQGFLSINPTPTESDYILKSDNKGFQTVKDYDELEKIINALLSLKLNFFSSMITKTELGRLIQIASQEKSDEEKAEKFLKLLKGDND